MTRPIRLNVPSTPSPNLFRNISFFNRWAKSYDFWLFQFWMGGFHRPVFEEIDFTKPAKVLDISCGTGELLKSLQERDIQGNLQLYGLDIAEEMLQKAKLKLPEPPVHFSQGDVHHLKFPANTFDYVLSTEAFHHYGDQRKALQEMVRVTKKGGKSRAGGKVIVVDVNFFCSFIHKLFQRFEPGCVKINSRVEMKKLFEEAGLNDVSQRRAFLFAVATVGRK